MTTDTIVQIKDNLAKINQAKEALAEAMATITPLVSNLVTELEAFDVTQRDMLFKEIGYGRWEFQHNSRRIYMRNYAGFEVEGEDILLNFCDRDNNVNDDWDYRFPSHWLCLDKADRDTVWAKYWSNYRDKIKAARTKKEEEQKADRYQQFLKLKTEFGENK
jgi:hypothetical protein